MMIGNYDVLFTAGDGGLNKDVWDYYLLVGSYWTHQFSTTEKPERWDELKEAVQ